MDEKRSNLNVDKFKKIIIQVIEAFSYCQVVATTPRTVKIASINDWGAVCWAEGEFYEASMRENLEIMDRVGGEISLASGLIYGLFTIENPQAAVNYGPAHGALAMTTP